MVLTYDAYSETLEKQQEKESEVQTIKERMDNLEKILFSIQPLLQHVKPEMLSKLQILDRDESLIGHNIQNQGSESPIVSCRYRNNGLVLICLAKANG